MKTLITLISILALQSVSSAQNTRIAAKKSAPSEITTVETFYVSASEDEQTKAECSPSNQLKTIVISNIPSSTSVLNSVNIKLDESGTFIFKEAKSLIIPSNRLVLIEDKVSGLLFNIHNSQSYTFEVEQNNSNRFVLHVLDKTNPDSDLTAN